MFTKRNLLFITLFIIFIVIVALIYFTFFSNRNIRIINNDRSYTVTYKDTRLIREYTRKWNFYQIDPNKMKNPSKEKIDEIRLVISEIPLTNYSYALYSDIELKNILVGSQSEYNSENKYLTISIYINPSINEAKDESSVRKFLIQSFMHVMYKKANDSNLARVSPDDFRKTLKSINENISENPFIVKINN